LQSDEVINLFYQYYFFDQQKGEKHRQNGLQNKDEKNNDLQLAQREFFRGNCLPGPQ
jgi:hypothetical protein